MTLLLITWQNRQSQSWFMRCQRRQETLRHKTPTYSCHVWKMNNGTFAADVQVGYLAPEQWKYFFYFILFICPLDSISNHLYWPSSDILIGDISRSAVVSDTSSLPLKIISKILWHLVNIWRHKAKSKIFFVVSITATNKYFVSFLAWY